MSETAKFKKNVELIRKVLSLGDNYDEVGETVYAFEDGELDMTALEEENAKSIVYAIGFVAGWCDTMNQSVSEVIDEVYHS
jgi:hypothetical protein